jgi:hypothetical protein
MIYQNENIANTYEKGSQNFGLLLYILKKLSNINKCPFLASSVIFSLSNVNKCPLSGNSSKLVTLILPTP